MKPILVLLSMILLVCCGCVAQQKPMYYWGDYSSTLYAYKKAPSAETLKQHMEMLQNIIAKSAEESLRVPPGVYAEYGYLLLQSGNLTQAMQYFLLEEQTYPESSPLMIKLRMAAEPVKPSEPAKLIEPARLGEPVNTPEPVKVADPAKEVMR